MSSICKAAMTLMLLSLMAGPAMADEPTAGDEADRTEVTASAGQAPQPALPSMAKAIAVVGACLGAGLCAVGSGYGIARIGAACIESIARQPEAGGAMFAPMVVAAAMVEGGMLFAIVVCLLGVLSM